ncbi:lysophospholipase L1-like esterase [Anaerobacterium chartisolvens]|uniref:Lysophospholipase L1-like esterase n=1 Tax=Anaerobacterium chartisolvens TaxID=1297424 RepID=A0A369BF49_9FIRM|nr:GDSL-type esterase/lipase family protein [Anaerobacterium chartisolvens]RCX20173.1 lysophospholipase L1-like esterase [Anaerobacterium chartisolvens]
MRQKVLCKVVGAILLSTVILGGMTCMNAVAAVSEYKFDFGNGAAQYGYTKVSASVSYNSARGYGFNTPQNMKDVAASGTGVAADAVQFLAFGVKSTNTFNVDLPNGLYEVKVVTGNISRVSIAAEGVFQIMNMTGNCAEDQFQIPVTDGQLNILATEGKAGTVFTLAAMEIKKLSDNPETNPTIYIGGDSTVCNYYPLDSSVQAGWGQMLSNYLDKSTFQIRNIATSGQYARGFRNDGQFEAIMKYIKPGDYFILQFGINDTNSKNNETEQEFKEIMRDMVKQVKAKGATVVLSTPQGRATDFNSSNVHTAVNRWYRHSTVALAGEEDVTLLDLNVLSSSYFTSIGPAAVLRLYMDGDTLHPNREGATQLARIVSENIRFSVPEPVPGGSPYQAEDMAYGGSGTIFEYKNTGYYGTGYINFPSSGGYLEFRNVDGGAGGDSTLMLRYALGSDTSRTGRIQVNGGAWKNITFDPTGNWTVWSLKEVKATLNRGISNTIRLESTGQDLANIDQLDIVVSAVTKGDVNNDGRVDTIDFVLIKKHILGIELLTGDAFKAADIDESGSIDTLDYLQMRKYLLGL